MKQNVVTIGVGQRITLSNIYDVAYGIATLAVNEEPTAALVPSIDVPLTTTTTTTMSLEYARAFCTIFANYVLQQQGQESCIVQRLVSLLQDAEEDVLQNVPTNADELRAYFQASIPELTEQSVPDALLTRIHTLTDVCLSGYILHVYVTQLVLPVASLTCDLSGHGNTLVSKYVTEANYNNTSDSTSCYQHRYMISSATTIRTIVNETKYTNANTTETVDAVLSTIPQYHGPIQEDICSIVKTLELEVNTILPTSKASATVVTDFIQQRLLASSKLLIHYSQQRYAVVVENHAGNTEPTAAVIAADESTSLYTLVQNVFVPTISREATDVVACITKTIQIVEEESKQKELEKQQKQNTNAGSKPGNAEDEFQGMSDAQVAKIQKKRAEKEAKAAKKAAARQEKGVLLFGTGTHSIVKMLAANTDSLLSPKVTDELSERIATLVSGGVQRKPKIAKGTRDYLPDQMTIRQQAFDIIRRVFTSHGAVEIDTPVFEHKDTLTGKYGEDTKLIYDLADQGGEILALRYDLTVPFARYLALNGVGNIKRYHIGKVYRRDQPALARGRYREFYQCDFDIAGVYGRMVPDSECLCVACDILAALPIGNFSIKLNHRCLLDAVLEISGVPANKFRTICSAIDKLDKEPWAEVKREMVEDKGLDAAVADKIGTYVQYKGKPMELYEELISTKRFGDHEGAATAMEDLRILFDYLNAFHKLQYISFDLSLARGLDYYTGVIYEAVCVDDTNTQVGSIGGGGRYDNLVGMFQEAGKQTPCVGVSVGIERVFTLMEAKIRKDHDGSIQSPNVSVVVASTSAGNTIMMAKMKIARLLWDANISADFNQSTTMKLKKEIVNVVERNIPYMVILDDDDATQCKIKDMMAKTEETVPVADLVSTLLNGKGIVPVGCNFAKEIGYSSAAPAT